METTDIRWIQRFHNYQKALNQLDKFLKKGDLNELEEQGLIQVFEYTYELSWNLIKDFYIYQGETEIQGSRDAFRLAFNRGLIKEGDLWMEMIQSRSLSSHTYSEEITEKVAGRVRGDYFRLFLNLKNVFTLEFFKITQNDKIV
ncbi:MAG: nucleotidyltransferase substrate binding protein [Ignavibacteriales bacterium]|nr:nucleotidyltransferase substrate binding protein [Ignavibacteriales bacterium]